MLAAECAWAVLRSEHARIRSLLALIEQTLGRAAQAGPTALAASLLAQIHELESFESTTHRPKGLVMVEIMRGRCPQAAELLTRLEQESERCSQLLSRAKAMLTGTQHGFADIESLLGAHRALMLSHLDQEDTLLHSQTARLLTAEEWASVASSISDAIRRDKQRTRARPKRSPAGVPRRSGECA